jgi:hypothetical protein
MNTLLKFLPWIVVIVVAIVGGIFLTQYIKQIGISDQLEIYNRQLSGQLTEKEEVLQRFNSDLGLAQSDLMTQKELNAKLAADKRDLDKKFEAFKKEHNLQVDSLSNTIASLKQQIIDGHSSTTITGDCDNIDKCIIGYVWQDTMGRFKLSDPNIFVKNNEIFYSSQLFSIHAEVYRQSDGSLKTQRLLLHEVYKDGEEYKDIEGGKAEVVQSSFDYVNPPILEEEFVWTDLFHIRPVFVKGIELYPEIPDVRIGVGAVFFGYKGLMLGSFTSFDFDSIDNITQNVSISYVPEINNIKLTFGVFASLGTPFVKPFQEYSLQTGIILYAFDY